MSQSAVADDFNWENISGQNWCSPIKDQESTGACWDFATCGALEEKYMLTRNDNTFKPDISEQQMVCDGSCGNDESGYQDKAMSYLTTSGVVSESELPFTYSDTSPNWPLATGWQNRAWKATANTQHLGTDIATIKADLKAYGPLVLFMQADNDWYIPSPGTYRGNHSIQIVGYHDDVNVPGGGYWIIKNSWGTGWNTGGPTYVNDGYGAVDYAARPQAASDIDAFSGAAYYTGAMKTVTWTGTGSNGPTWTTTIGSGYYNFSDNARWVNQETWATFDNSASNRTVSIINTVIAHQLTFGTVTTGTGNYTLNNGSGGSLTVTAGGIQANESATINVPVTVGAPQTWTTASGKTLNVSGALHTIISNLTIDGAGTTIIGGPIDGGGILNTVGGDAPGNLIKTGTGTLTLSGATSNYPATITVSAGMLSLAPVNGTTATYTGAILGNGALQKNDQGTVVLSVTNPNFGGTIAVNQGQLTINTAQALGTATAAVAISGGQLNVNYAGTTARSFTISSSGILNQMTGSGTYSGTVSCTGAAEVRSTGGSMTLNNGISGSMGGGALTINGVSSNTITLTGNLSVSGNSGVTFSNGTTVLSGSANSWAGVATITNGTLTPTKATNLPSTATFTLNSGTLNLNSYSQSIAGITSLVPASDLVTSSGACTLTVSPTSDTTYAGQLSGPINLTKSGSSKFILSGNNNLGASVTTTISAGTLQIGGGGTTGTLQGNVTDSGVLAFARSDNVTFAGTISGASGSLAQQGPGTLALTATNTYGGGTTINGGTLQIGAGGTVGSITGNVAISSGTLAFSRSDDVSFGGNISGAAGSLVKQGTNALTLTGSNTYGGGTTINGGTLQIGAGGTSGGIAGNVAINSGTLAFSRSDNVTFGGNISGCPGSLVKQGANALTLTGTNTYCGGTIINGGTLQIGGGGTSGSIAGAVTVNSGTLAFYRSDDTSFSGNIGGGGGVIKYGTNCLNLSGTNNYAGRTIVAGGTLELAPSAQNCVLNLGGADLQAGKIVFDYAGGADPATTIQGMLSASYDNGLWDVGQFKDTTATATGLTLGCLDNPSTQTVTVMATYPGDFNLDGVVDSQDKSIWFANAFSGTTWQQGDANHDGVVDGLDRDLWIAHAGLTAPTNGMLPSSSSAMSPVPEPGTLALLAAGLIGLLVYNWRRNKE